MKKVILALFLFLILNFALFFALFQFLLSLKLTLTLTLTLSHLQSESLTPNNVKAEILVIGYPRSVSVSDSVLEIHSNADADFVTFAK